MSETEFRKIPQADSEEDPFTGANNLDELSQIIAADQELIGVSAELTIKKPQENPRKEGVAKSHTTSFGPPITPETIQFAINAIATTGILIKGMRIAKKLLTMFKGKEDASMDIKIGEESVEITTDGINNAKKFLHHLLEKIQAFVTQDTDLMKKLEAIKAAEGLKAQTEELKHKTEELQAQIDAQHHLDDAVREFRNQLALYNDLKRQLEETSGTQTT